MSAFSRRQSLHLASGSALAALLIGGCSAAPISSSENANLSCADVYYQTLRDEEAKSRLEVDIAPALIAERKLLQCFERSGQLERGCSERIESSEIATERDHRCRVQYLSLLANYGDQTDDKLPVSLRQTTLSVYYSNSYCRTNPAECEDIAEVIASEIAQQARSIADKTNPDEQLTLYTMSEQFRWMADDAYIPDLAGSLACLVASDLVYFSGYPMVLEKLKPDAQRIISNCAEMKNDPTLASPYAPAD
ncbi:MAG: hypothetical protein RIB03_16210 [Henriciella sp.]|uniref:hypothetical protein n=1 Tax=Henriciella sp. TaxID=1968823 RepID=UPI0032EFA3D2